MCKGSGITEEINAGDGGVHKVDTDGCCGIGCQTCSCGTMPAGDLTEECWCCGLRCTEEFKLAGKAYCKECFDQQE